MNHHEYIAEKAKDLALRCLENSLKGEGADFRVVHTGDEGNIACYCGLNFRGIDDYCMMQQNNQGGCAKYASACSYFEGIDDLKQCLNAKLTPVKDFNDSVLRVRKSVKQKLQDG